MNNWILWASLSAFFAGLTAVLAKWGIEGADADCVTLFRTIVVVVMAVVIVSIRGAWAGFGAIPRASYTALFLSGLATGLSWLCYYRALALAPATQVAPVDKSSLLVTLVLAALFLIEPFTPRLVCAALLVFAGALLAMRP